MLVRLRYAVLAILLLAAPTALHAQSAADRADRLNEEGKDLWLKKNDLTGAVEKFRQAIQLSPEARFYFNLCYSLHQLGRFREALPECRAAQGGDADDKLRKKAQVVIDDIESRLPSEPADPGYDPDGSYSDPDGADPGDPQDPQQGVPGDTVTSAPGHDPGPVAGLFQPAEVPDDYKWSFGAGVGLLSSTVGGDYFAGSGMALKLFADFMWLPDQRIGAQVYLNIAQLSDGDNESLELADLGGALYKHLPMRSFYITPLVGVHATAMQSRVFLADALGTLGLRGEAAFSWLVGPDRRHVISVTPALSVYLPVSEAEFDAVPYGLNKPGASLSLTVSYALRFMTPFGQTSLITLE